MTRTLAARLAVAWTFGVCAVAGCHAHAPAALLAKAADGGPGPEVRRVALAVEGEELSKVLYGAFVDTTTPFESLVYDAARDRFVVPGFYAIDRAGQVSFDPEPMAGPTGAQARPAAELRAALRLQPGRDLIAAVWYGTDAIVVLRAQVLPSKANPHAHRRPDVLVVDRMDPATLSVIDEVHLPLLDGFDPQHALDQFVRSGTIVVVLDLRRGNRTASPGLSEKLPRVHGRGAIVRLGPSGEATSIAPGPWSPAVSHHGLVGGRVARRLARRSRGAIATTVSTNGVCTVEMHRAEKIWQWHIACFDRDVNLRWRRYVPWEVSDWLIDDAGWIYLARRDPRSSAYAEAMEIVAVTPDGDVAWRSPQRPPKGGMIAAQDELCFVTEPPADSAAFRPELVCIGPRHGRK